MGSNHSLHSLANPATVRPNSAALVLVLLSTTTIIEARSTVVRAVLSRSGFMTTVDIVSSFSVVYGLLLVVLEWPSDSCQAHNFLCDSANGLRLFLWVAGPYLQEMPQSYRTIGHTW